ncbi:hypothetical protein BCR43DRAFT_506334 [Syncephalastrum racemosum]|uniref:Uncharacterized protein n=1 Tax=Syncephalastrum racemosum TaxID=13706 RepID=A0A1X2HB58_SYNRA|nr:hypothetical protein BCR43DRAFT_506334 [Syncephalastrum racemosum]
MDSAWEISVGQGAHFGNLCNAHAYLVLIPVVGTAEASLREFIAEQHKRVLYGEGPLTQYMITGYAAQEAIKCFRFYCQEHGVPDKDEAKAVLIQMAEAQIEFFAKTMRSSSMIPPIDKAHTQKLLSDYYDHELLTGCI